MSPATARKDGAGYASAAVAGGFHEAVGRWPCQTKVLLLDEPDYRIDLKKAAPKAVVLTEASALLGGLRRLCRQVSKKMRRCARSPLPRRPKF